MIRILESLDDIEHKVNCELKEEVNIVDETIVDDWLNITLAGLDDRIVYKDVDTSTPDMITVDYYFLDDEDEIYLGQWDINYEEMINLSEVDKVKILDNISAEVEASASEYEDFEY